MSRGFVKEEDQEEPVFIPPRAPLPPGFDNLVTSRGLRLLHEERVQLEKDRKQVDHTEGPARRRALAELNGRLAQLDERISNARIVETNDAPDARVRFGCTVRFLIIAGPQHGTRRTFTLVGVDEARVAEGRIAYTSPIAQALMGKALGERVEFKHGNSLQVLAVEEVSWPSGEPG